MIWCCLIFRSTINAILGHIFLSIEIYRSSWSHMILITHEMHVELMVYCYLIVIPQWSLFWVIRSGSRFLIFRCHHATFSRRHLFDVWTWLSCEYGWLGLHIWWWMIWCCLIFRSTIHLMPYWGIFSLWLRFIDLHRFSCPPPLTRCMSSWWSTFILSDPLVESFLGHSVRLTLVNI